MTTTRRFRDGDEPGPLGRTPLQWRTWAEAKGERPFRGTQIFKWLHGRNELDPQAMTDLPKQTRLRLAEELDDRLPTIDAEHGSEDGTRKLVVRVGGNAAVETVLIPMTDSSGQDPDDPESEDDADPDATTPRIRVTQCISTQAGCAMGCAFCASGVHGLRRHLTPSEIVSQVLLGKTRLRPDERLSNVVLMGMGEPLHNFDATVQAVRVLADDLGIGLSTRRLTISTVGLIPEIERLGRVFHGRIGLAISLHAADDTTRSRLVPINRKYSLGDLMKALRRYPLPPRRRITIEYALIAGVNDDDATAHRLVGLLRGIPAKVNLIPLNPVPHMHLRPSPQHRVLGFQKVLTQARVCHASSDVAEAMTSALRVGSLPDPPIASRAQRESHVRIACCTASANWSMSYGLLSTLTAPAAIISCTTSSVAYPVTSMKRRSG